MLEVGRKVVKKVVFCCCFCFKMGCSNVQTQTPRLRHHHQKEKEITTLTFILPAFLDDSLQAPFSEGDRLDGGPSVGFSFGKCLTTSQRTSTDCADSGGTMWCSSSLCCYLAKYPIGGGNSNNFLKFHPDFFGK